MKCREMTQAVFTRVKPFNVVQAPKKQQPQVNVGFLYTAISIYVVGSKLQAYATRPKGGMGRLELILGFRGCRREMDMEAENTISIALRVLTKSNKNRYDSYCLKAVPLFETVKGLKEYLVQKSGEELKPATTGEDFTLGYFGEGNKKFTIKSELQLAEALSLVKRGMVTLWADPHLPKPGKPQGHSSALAKKRKGMSQRAL